jgi:hypothetical protein
MRAQSSLFRGSVTSLLVVLTLFGCLADRYPVTEPPPTTEPPPPTTEPPPPTVRQGYYAAPGGTSGGDGSWDQPWDLTTALAGGKGRVQPGDTIWLRGGTYWGAFRSTLTGTAGAPIVVRQYPGERAIIDSKGVPGTTDAFVAAGAYSIFWGFELTKSDPTRVFNSTSSSTVSNMAIANAPHTKFINLVIHDGGNAFYTWPAKPDVEIYGSIIYNNGWQGSDRGHGHGMYLKNDLGPVVARDNVIFNQFGYGIHVYSNAGDGLLNGIRLEGNVSFNNGTLATNSTSLNLLVGGGEPADDIVVQSNMTYFSPGTGATNVRIGYPSTLENGTVLFADNFAIGGNPVYDVGYWQSATVRNSTFAGDRTILSINDPTTSGHTWSGNLYCRDPLASAWKHAGTTYSFSGWKSATGLGATDAATANAPTSAKVFVRPNAYEAGRANIIVYNWAGAAAVAVDVSGILQVGDAYEVRNVQDLFGSPVVSGTYGGGSISIPQSATPAPIPYGMTSSPAPVTGPAFNVYLLRKSAA